MTAMKISVVRAAIQSASCKMRGANFCDFFTAAIAV